MLKTNGLYPVALGLGAALLLAPLSSASAQSTPVDYVNPYIGNISHLLVPTYPTMHLPNGMLRVIPDRGDFTAPRVGGLPLLSTSHRGQSAFSLKPYAGPLSGQNQWMRYSYDQEKIKPYLYTVTLEGELAKSDDIDVRFAPGYQAGIYRFEYPNDAPRSFSFNSGDGEIKVEGATISAIQNLGNRTKAYVYIVFSETPQSSGTFNNGAPNVQTPQPPVVTTSGGGASVYVAFSKSRAPITARYGVSFISVEQARKNLEKEIPTFDFNAVEKKGRAAWNTALGKLEVQGGTSDQKTV
ncbi:glycoside hydrolase family 92 protein, partial [bacterium]